MEKPQGGVYPGEIRCGGLGTRAPSAGGGVGGAVAPVIVAGQAGATAGVSCAQRCTVDIIIDNDV